MNLSDVGKGWHFSEKMNEWLSTCGNKSSIPKDFLFDYSKTSMFPPDFAIQQNENEIMEFVGVLKKYNVKNVLEIGLGSYGSTHVLFRENFEQVTTIELSLERVRSFFQKVGTFFGEGYFASHRSNLLVADSNSSSAAIKILEVLEQHEIDHFDAIFIDGFHQFDHVLLDFLIYYNFVKKGGVIAFHDIKNRIEGAGVPKLVEIIRHGPFREMVAEYTEIFHSDHLGIGYFIKK